MPPGGRARRPGTERGGAGGSVPRRASAGATPLTPPETGDADVIIVGSGAVGLTAAISLARQGVRTLVLEAGPALPPADFAAHNVGRSVGRQHKGLRTGRMRALGGTTRLWGGQLVPFDARDIDGPTVNGPSPWPIRFADLAPAIAQAYVMLGVDERASDTDAVWRSVTGLPAMLGQRLRLGLNLWLRQPDFTRVFADELTRLPQLRVLTDHPVTRLRFVQPGVVAAVETASAGGAFRRFSAARVVLAAGTFDNVKLLLRTAATEPVCGSATIAISGRGSSTICTGWPAASWCTTSDGCGRCSTTSMSAGASIM